MRLTPRSSIPRSPRPARFDHLGARCALLGALLPLLACKASFSTGVSTPERGGVTTTSTVQATPPAARSAVRIVRTGNKLAYENGEIEFETGSAALKGGETSEVLDRLAAALRRYPTLLVRIEGHTDSRGSDKFNQRLSEDRAAAIKTALVERKVAEERLTSAGFGEDQPERPEPPACRNRPEERVPADKLDECRKIWTANRRAAFVITEGGDDLPGEGDEIRAEEDEAPAEPAPKPAVAEKRRPDWALRVFGGYSLWLPGEDLHGGHVGVAVHASQRFGKRQRGYIGGGPRLHYRGLTGASKFGNPLYRHDAHQFGPEGDLLVGGGSAKVVALFSLRVGIGLGTLRTREDDGIDPPLTTRSLGLAGWALGGLVVLGKLTPRWSLGGHAEAGISGASFLAEVGLNVAWHFGRGRRDGI